MIANTQSLLQCRIGSEIHTVPNRARTTDIDAWGSSKEISNDTIMTNCGVQIQVSMFPDLDIAGNDDPGRDD
jgi:hypothetical protein